MNLYIISVFKAAYEHILQTCIMSASFVCIQLYMSMYVYVVHVYVFTQRLLQFLFLPLGILSDAYVFCVHLKIISGAKEFGADFVFKKIIKIKISC